MSKKAKTNIQKQTPVSVLYLYDYSMIILCILYLIIRKQ